MNASRPAVYAVITIIVDHPPSAVGGGQKRMAVMGALQPQVVEVATEV